MESVINTQTLTSGLSLTEAIAAFFKNHSLDDARVLFWKFFQCWVTKDCNQKAEVSDEEIALFFDQLVDLVAAAYIVHQANGASLNPQEGNGHE